MPTIVQQPARFAVGHDDTAIPPDPEHSDVGNPFWMQSPPAADSSHAPVAPVVVDPLELPVPLEVPVPPELLVEPLELPVVSQAGHLFVMHEPAVWSADSQVVDVRSAEHFSEQAVSVQAQGAMHEMYAPHAPPLRSPDANPEP